MACRILSRRFLAQAAVMGRQSTCVQPSLSRMMVTGPKFGKVEEQEFYTVFPDIVRDVTSSDEYSDVKDAQKWLSKLLQYNLPGGRKNRGLTIVQVYQQLTKVTDQTPDKMKLVRIMGWALEMLHSFFLMNDDIMDDSETRRQRISWHKKSEVGIFAINDAVLLQASMFELLRVFFKDQPYYIDIMELFHEAILKTSMGVAMDIQLTHPNKPVNLDLYTMNTYNTIVKYKNLFYSFYLPLALAMHMAGINRPELYRQAKTLTTEIGHYFQVEMDYLDCFGGPEVTWVKGTDIKNAKCTWLIVMALQRLSPDQRRVLDECYGKKDNASVAKVKEMYEEIGLREVFRRYSKDQYQYLDTLAHQTSKGLPQEIFLRLMSRIFHKIN